jgi:hypothetical protein
MKEEILFTERQHFRQIWLWVLMLGINGIFIYGIIQQIGYGIPYGDKPASDTTLIVASLFLIALTVSLAIMRLDTRITRDGIYVRFFPIHRSFRFYSWPSLRYCYVRKYNPILEYGGWGLRGMGGNRALNMSGNKGIQLVTIDGLKMLIGTQKADEVTQILQKHGWWNQLV